MTKYRSLSLLSHVPGIARNGTVRASTYRPREGMRRLHDVLQDPDHQGAGKAPRRLVTPCGDGKGLRDLCGPPVGLPELLLPLDAQPAFGARMEARQGEVRALWRRPLRRPAIDSYRGRPEFSQCLDEAAILRRHQEMG